MEQHPEYLKIQAAYVHRLHRRNRRFLRWFLIIWFAGLSLLTGVAALDIAANMGWGHDIKDVWGGLGLMAFGWVLWLFARVIMSATLGMSRRIYGPDPAQPPRTSSENRDNH